MSWRKGGGGEESERLQCWSHVIAVAAERSLEESWLGANTAEKGEKERERSEPPLNIDREREKEERKKSRETEKGQVQIRLEEDRRAAEDGASPRDGRRSRDRNAG